MEGFEQPKIKLRPADEPTKIETRGEKHEQAERSVVEMFKIKMAEVLERIGENPYFRDLEKSF